MRSEISNGIVSGLVAGVIFGIIMQLMNVPTPEGGRMPMMAMVADVVRSDSISRRLDLSLVEQRDHRRHFRLDIGHPRS